MQLVAPAINFGLSWSLPSLFKDDIIVFSFFSHYTYMQLLCMMVTMFLYNVNYVFWDK